MMHVATLQPEETEEDKVAHENLKKVKASERSVVAMQAKYKVCTNINTNASARLVEIQIQCKIQDRLSRVECDKGMIPK